MGSNIVFLVQFKYECVLQQMFWFSIYAFVEHININRGLVIPFAYLSNGKAHVAPTYLVCFPDRLFAIR